MSVRGQPLYVEAVHGCWHILRMRPTYHPWRLPEAHVPGLLIVNYMAASASSVIVRARHTGRVERQKIKWLAYGVRWWWHNPRG